MNKYKFEMEFSFYENIGELLYAYMNEFHKHHMQICKCGSMCLCNHLCMCICVCILACVRVCET